MTELLAASDHSTDSTKGRSNWITYLFLGLIANAAIWSAAFYYLKNTSPTYTSNWALTLPGARGSTSVNVPDVGGAFSQIQNPYGNNSDPRENYKFIIESEAVRKAAAAQLNIPENELGDTRIRVVQNTTLMMVEVEGDSPEQAQKQSWAIFQALQDRLKQLRVEEGAQQRAEIQSTLVESQRKLELAQTRLSEYKTRSGLASGSQIEQLSGNIEQLRQKRAEVIAQQRQTNARLQELTANLNLNASEAADAFTLKADPLFKQYRQDYSTATTALTALTTKYGPQHPSVVRERGRQQATQAAMLQRSQVLLGRPAQESTLAQLNVDDGQGGSARETLFRDLVTIQVDKQGHDATAQELDRQITQLEARLQTLGQFRSTMDALQRDMQVAEAVFSSTLAGLDIGKSQVYGTYPHIQMLAQPSYPGSPTSPDKKFTVLGALGGSVCLTAGLILFAMRKRLLGKRKTTRLEQIELTHLESRRLRPEFRSETVDLSNKK